MLYNPHTGEYANNRISRCIFNLLKWHPGIPSTLSTNPKPKIDLPAHFVIKEIILGSLLSALNDPGLMPYPEAAANQAPINEIKGRTPAPYPCSIDVE